MDAVFRIIAFRNMQAVVHSSNSGGYGEPGNLCDRPGFGGRSEGEKVRLQTEARESDK